MADTTESLDPRTADELARVESNHGALERLIEELEGRGRRSRQFAAHVIALVADRDPELLSEYVPDLIDALYRPEAQTRWEILDALTLLVPQEGVKLAEALDGAEAALFDDASSTLRLSAFRFLATWAALTEKGSAQVWPILDEAIQCYHGDLEYRDMLGCVYVFAQGALSAEVAAELAARLKFDAEGGKGTYLRARSKEILEVLTERFGLEDNPKRKRAAKAAASGDEE